MRLLLVNVILAVLWVFLWSDLTLYTLAVGFGLGYGVLYLFTRVVRRDLLRDAYGQWIIDVVSFAIYFAKLLFKSNWETATEILTPGINVSPRIVRYEVTGMTDLEITTLSNCITLTPGTLVVDLREEAIEDAGDDEPSLRRWVYVHCLYAEDREKAIADLDQLRHTLLRKVFQRR